MENNKPLNKYSLEEETINLKELIRHILKKWYLFVIFGVIGLIGGFIVTKIIQPKYEIQAKLYAPNKNENIGIQDIFNNMRISAQTDKLNYVGILGSFSLTKQTIENLDWRISWYEDVVFSENDLYIYAPFKIESFNPLLNLPRIKINVIPINNEFCEISVNEKIKRNGVEKKIDFTTRYKYGDSLQNEYFNFILNKEAGRSIDINKKYFFTFNDLSSLSNLYIEKLDISLENREADIIVLTVEGSQPEREADYLNELCRVFINFGLREKNRTAENTVNFIDAQLLGIVDSLQSAGQSFTNFRSRNRIVDLSQEAGLVVERLELLESQESQAKMRLEYYQNLSSYLGDADKMEQVIAPSVVGITDPALNSMVVSLGDLYSQKSTLSFSVQDKNPSLLALENDIKYMRQSLDENLKNLISNAEIELTSLQQRKSQINNQLAQLPKKEQDLGNIKRQFDLNNELYTYLLKKRAEAAITKASNVPDVKILDFASVETANRLEPKTPIILMIGLFLGLLIPGLIILYIYYTDQSIKNKEDIEKITSIPVINIIGHSRKKEELPVLNHPHSGITESFRILRTNLDFLAAKDDNKVIAIHSTIPYEGKTFFAINLASIIAQNNKSVLLIGADMRKPKIQTIFNLPNEKGLSTFLINRNQIDDIIVNSRIRNLNIITSGPTPPNPTELLGNGKMKTLLNKAREYFDYVIVDNAPSSVVADALITGEEADINLFVTRSEYTSKDQVKLINQYKNQGTFKNIFIVLNDFKDISSNYKYYSNKEGYGSFAKIKSKTPVKV
jgi:capsular exopolysaccharide synthesis family protein